MGNRSGHSVPPYLRLLGPVELLGCRGPAPTTVDARTGRRTSSHTGRALSLIAYLAVHGARSVDDVDTEVFPCVERSTRYSTVRRARAWLGQDDDHRWFLPLGYSHQLELQGVGTDWGDWRGLVGDDIAVTPLPRLVAGLGLVRGRPFGGVAEHLHRWADGIRQDMTRSVLDVAHEVVQRTLTQSLAGDASADLGVARTACGVAITVDPTSEQACRDWLRVAHYARDRVGLSTALQHLRQLRADYDELEPATDALIRRIHRGGPAIHLA